MSYMKLVYGKHPVERGFFAHEKDRKVEAIYVFYRINAQSSHMETNQVTEPPNIRIWQRFCDIFFTRSTKLTVQHFTLRSTTIIHYA